MVQVDDRQFPPTNWGLVGDASCEPSGEQAPAQLDMLLQLYMPPLLTHLILAKGLSRDHAEDLLQNFVQDKILTGDLLSRADCTRGKFRTFLLTSLQNFMVSEFRKERARKRSPEGAMLPLDMLPDQEDAKSAQDISRVFDLSWVQHIIKETLRRVESECIQTDRKTYWLLFEDRLVKPALQGTNSQPYAVMVQQLGFSSPIQAANAVFTVKRMFVRNFRAVIKSYAGENGQIDEEISDLYAILNSLSA